MAKTDRAKASRRRMDKSGGKEEKAIATNIPKSRARPKAAQKAVVPLTPEFVDDLKMVFAKHNWSGHPIGFVANPAAANVDAEPCDPEPPSAPDRTEPRQQWIHWPDGTSILRNLCR